LSLVTGSHVAANTHDPAHAMSASKLCLFVNLAGICQRSAAGEKLQCACLLMYGTGIGGVLPGPTSLLLRESPMNQAFRGANCARPLHTVRSHFPAYQPRNDQAKVFMSMRGGQSIDCRPDDVLEFWFGEEYAKDRAAMKTEAYGQKMSQRWFGSSAEFDKEIKDKFSEVIRAVAAGTSSCGWEEEGGNGRLARIILFDQLSRNAFRGTPEAFAYDEAAVKLARACLKEDFSDTPISVLQFSLMPLMHSELLSDQEALISKLEERAAAGKRGEVSFLLAFAEEHRQVVARFHRFPHRNSHFRRHTTAEEAAWLASEECPAWAKSQ